MPPPFDLVDGILNTCKASHIAAITLHSLDSCLAFNAFFHRNPLEDNSHDDTIYERTTNACGCKIENGVVSAGHLQLKLSDGSGRFSFAAYGSVIGCCYCPCKNRNYWALAMYRRRHVGRMYRETGYMVVNIRTFSRAQQRSHICLLITSLTVDWINIFLPNLRRAGRCSAFYGCPCPAWSSMSHIPRAGLCGHPLLKSVATQPSTYRYL